MKKIISLLLTILISCCLITTIFADNEADLRESAAENVLNWFKNDEILSRNFDGDFDELSAVAYPTYNELDDSGRAVWVGLIYDGETCVDNFIMKSNGNTVFAEGSLMGEDLDVGLSAFKEKSNVTDKDITLFLTLEGVYASINGDTDNLYRVGNRFVNSNIAFADNSYSLSQIKRAENALKKEGQRRLEAGEVKMGGENDILIITDFMKPAFPIFGFVLIGVGLVALGLAVFLAVRAKKIGYGGKK